MINAKNIIPSAKAGVFDVFWVKAWNLLLKPWQFMRV